MGRGAPIALGQILRGNQGARGERVISCGSKVYDGVGHGGKGSVLWKTIVGQRGHGRSGGWRGARAGSAPQSSALGRIDTLLRSEPRRTGLHVVRCVPQHTPQHGRSELPQHRTAAAGSQWAPAGGRGRRGRREAGCARGPAGPAGAAGTSGAWPAARRSRGGEGGGEIRGEGKKSMGEEQSKGK